MFWKNIKYNKVQTVILILVMLLFMITSYKVLLIYNNINQEFNVYKDFTGNKEFGYLMLDTITKDYENIYYDIDNITGVNVTNSFIYEDVNNLVIDKTVFDYLTLPIEKGRSFTAEDFTQYITKNQIIPVVIGQEYAKDKQLDVGSKFQGECIACQRNGIKTSESMSSGNIIQGAIIGDDKKDVQDPQSIDVTYEVIGILQNNAKVPVLSESSFPYNPEVTPTFATLDSIIISPFRIDKASLNTKEQQKYLKGEFVFPEENPYIILDLDKITIKDFKNKLKKI